jgi:uncharacterized protein YjbI with pentapeptide repeats/predicted ABC-type ATPase
MNAVTSITAAKMKALREAKKLGCSGAHQTDDGIWRPCSSAEALAKIIPSSPSGVSGSIGPRRQQRGNNNMRRQWEPLGARGVVSIDTLAGGGLVSGVVGKQYQPAAPRDEDPDVFTDIEVARDRSRQLGCIGVSRRTSRSGRTVWMPCTNMSDLANRTGRTSLGRRNMQKRTERFIADVVRRNQPKATRSRKKSLYNDLHSNGDINTKGLGPKVGRRIGRGLRAAPAGFVFIDITGAIDADKDGIVFEGLPLERPIIPRFIIPEGTARRVQNLIGTTAQANEQNRRNGLSVDGAIDKTVLSQIIGTTPNDVPDKREDPLLSKLRNVLGSPRKPSAYTQSAVEEDERVGFGDPNLEISRFSARFGKREAAGSVKALDAVDDEYEYFTTGELSDLVAQLVPGSNEELMDALKSSPYTKKNAKQIYKRIVDAEPDYEATLSVRKILQDELFRNPGVRNAIRRYGIPPIVVTGYEPDIANMGFVDITSGPRMWQSIIGGYAANGFIAFNSGVFPDPDTGRIRDSLFRDEDLDSLVRHELAHAWQFMAAKQGGAARDYLISMYQELQENLQQGRGNAASQNYSEALYRSVTWGSEEERASARRISSYAETARLEWFAESFAAFTDDDPSSRMRVDNTSIKNMADVWGMSVNEFLTFVGERNQDQLSERARSSSTRSVSNLLLGEMSKPEKEAHDWLLNNPNYIADAPDAMLLRLPPDTLDNFIRNQRMSTRSRYNTDISKAEAKAEEARRNGELGQRVLDALFDRATGENSSSRPTMWFVGGTTGSGKSTLRGNGVLTGVPDVDTAVDIDPDVIKSMHPDWDNGRGASAVHAWSTQWALYGMRQATAQNRDYVVTGTGVRVDQMLIGKDNGYRIIGHYVHVPTDIAEKRMASRGKQGGVQLPSYLASQYAAELQWKVRKAITNGYMNEFHLWDNSQDENNATLAAIRREDGTFEIFNRKVFNEFFGKEGALAVEKHWESQRAETTTGSVLASARSSSQHSGFSTRSSRNRNLPEKLILTSEPNRRKTVYRKDLRGKRTANSELVHIVLGGDVDLSDSGWNSTYFSNVTADNLKTSQPLNFNNARMLAVSLKNTIIPPESNFNRATLERVAFDGSDIFNVDFSETSLRGVDFSKTKVGNINLRGAILERVEFDVADLSNSGLTIEDLRGSGIIWTDRTKFSPEIQQFINSLPSGQVINKNGKYSFKVDNESTTPINKADRYYASIRQARLGRRKIEVPTLESDGQAISGMDGTGGRISDADWKRLAGKRITSSYMARLSAINQDVVDVKITHSWMDNAQFTKSTLQDVSLAGSILQRAVFRGADIRGVLNLRGTDLQLADFNGAKVDADVLRIGTIDLREADLTEAKLGNLPLGRLKLDNAILKGAVWNGPTSMIPKDLRDRGLTGTRSMSQQTSYGAAIQINDLSDRLSNATRLSNREKTELVQDMSSMYRELLDSKIQRPERQEFADFIESLKDASSKDLDRFRVPTMDKRPMLLIESARANNKQSFVERFKKVRENEPEFMKGLSVIQAWKQASAAADKTEELENLHMQALDELREERAVAQSLPQLQNILHGDFLDNDNRKRPTGKLPSGKRAKETIISSNESTRSRRIETDKPLPLSEISPDLSDKFPATNTQIGGVTTIALPPERRRISERLSRLLRRSYSAITNDGRGNYLPAATKDILEDVLRDDLTKLQDGTFLRMSARESLKDDKERLLNSLRIIFDTREGSEAVNLPTMHAEPYEPFRSMVDPEIDWSSIYLPTEQDAEDLLREINTLKIDGYDLETEIRLNLQQWQKINREHQDRFRTNDELPLDEDESFDETFVSVYEEGMRHPSRFGTLHDAMHLAVGRGFDRHGEYAAILAEISYTLQIPELSDKMRNIVASGSLRQVLGVPFGGKVEEIIPDIQNSVFDMPKVFDAMIRRSTYKGVGGNDSRISTRSMRSMRDASDADIDAIAQEYLSSERFSRRLSEVSGIDAPRSLRSTRSTALDELSDEEIRALATRKGLTEQDLGALYKAIVDARDFIRRNKGESFSYAPGLGEETARRMRDSIRVEIAPNGVPMVMAEPFEAVIDEVPDKRDWSKVLAPSIKDIERLVDAIRKARDSDSPILEELSEESRDRVTKAAYYIGEPESPFDKIISQIFEKLGSTEYRGTRTGAYDSWVGIYLEGLADPKRMQAGLGSDGIHDFFGHFGVGRGFDRHGEWAAALVTDSLIRDHPAFDFLTPDERESLRREFFTGGAGGAMRLRQQLETEYEQRFGIPMDFATQRYDVPSGRFVDVVDTRTPEERDTAELFKEIGRITYGELAAMYDTGRRQYFSMDEILDLLGVPPTTTRSEKQNGSRILRSTRSSRNSTPLTEASNELLLSIAGNEAAIKKERSMRSTRSGRRELTDSEKQRLKPVNMEVNEKKKFQPGTTLVYTDRDDQVIRTELVGPQVLRIRGIEGVNVYIDPTPDNQDEVDTRMRQWEIDYGPVSSPSRQAQNTGGQAKRDLRERDRPQTTANEDPLDRILREVEENERKKQEVPKAWQNLSTRSRTDTYAILDEKNFEEILDELELNDSEKDIARTALLNIYDLDSNLTLATRQKELDKIKNLLSDNPTTPIDEKTKEAIKSISIKVSSNGVPIIFAQPHPTIGSVLPNRKWSEIEAPSREYLKSIFKKLQFRIDKQKYMPDRNLLRRQFLDRNNEARRELEKKFNKQFIDIVRKLQGHDLADEYKQYKELKGSWVQQYVGLLLNPARGSTISAVEHDILGHFGTGRGFDRHGEWANAMALTSFILDSDLFDLDEKERDAMAMYWLEQYGLPQIFKQFTGPVDKDKEVQRTKALLEQIWNGEAGHEDYGFDGSTRELIAILDGENINRESTRSASTRSIKLTEASPELLLRAEEEASRDRSEFVLKSTLLNLSSRPDKNEIIRGVPKSKPRSGGRSIQSLRSTRLISSTTPQLRISEDGSRIYMDASAKEAFLRDPKRVLNGLTEADIPEGYFPKGQMFKLEGYRQDLLALATLDSLVPNTEGYGVSARNLFAIDVLDASKPNPPMDIQRGIRRGILGTRRTEKIFHQADVVSLKVDEALFVTDIPATSKMSAIDNAIIFRNTDGSLSLIEIENADELDVIEGLMDEAKQRVNENGVGVFMLNDIIPPSPASTVYPVVKILENYHTTIADIDPRIPRPNIIFKADFFAQQIPGFDPKQVAGTAYPDNNSIVLWRTSEELPSVDIMLHEFGHSVDFTLGHRVVRGGEDISYSSDYNFSAVANDWEPATESDEAHGYFFGEQNMEIAVLANTGQAEQPTSAPGTTYRNIALERDALHGPRIGDKFITKYAQDTGSLPEDFAESASLFLRDKMFGYVTSVTSPSGERREYTFAEMYPNRAAILEKVLYPSTRSASKFDARFKSAYGADPIYGDGDCYEAASNMASRLRGEEFGFSDDQIRIVHGVPLGTGGDATGIRYGHAWAEVAKNGWDKYEQLRNEIAEVLREAENLTSQSLKNSLAARHNKLMMELVRMELEDVEVYDFSNGNEHIIPKYLYYKIGNIEDENTRYYSRRDADIKMQADETYGPWE